MNIDKKPSHDMKQEILYSNVKLTQIDLVSMLANQQLSSLNLSVSLKLMSFKIKATNAVLIFMGK